MFALNSLEFGLIYGIVGLSVIGFGFWLGLRIRTTKCVFHDFDHKDPRYEERELKLSNYYTERQMKCVKCGTWKKWEY